MSKFELEIPLLRDGASLQDARLEVASKASPEEVARWRVEDAMGHKDYVDSTIRERMKYAIGRSSAALVGEQLGYAQYRLGDAILDQCDGNDWKGLKIRITLEAISV